MSFVVVLLVVRIAQAQEAVEDLAKALDSPGDGKAVTAAIQGLRNSSEYTYNILTQTVTQLNHEQLILLDATSFYNIPLLP